MHAPVRKLTITEGAELDISTLRDENKHLVAGWLERLRNWDTDDFGRKHSVRQKPDGDTYVFHSAASDLLVIFRLTEDEVEVQSLLNKGWLRFFQKTPEGTAV